MRSELINALRGREGNAVEIECYTTASERVVDGVLREADGYWYPVIDGVPCFLRGGMRPSHEEFRQQYGLSQVSGEQQSFANEEQSSTNETFSDKWRRFKNYGLEPSHKEFLFQWYCEKLGFDTVAELQAFYRGKQRILECGPGSGFNSRFMAEQTAGQVFALDISEAAFTTFENVRDLPNCNVVQADLMDAPFDDNYFDFIIADGVLHHTPDTRKAVEALYKKLSPGGQFFFYVYREMGPLRKYCDDYVRERYTQMEPEACYAACEGFTELGEKLSQIDATITLEKGIPILGIPPGEHKVQRLLYYNVVKCFWNDAFDWETNNMVNFDWYHPHNAWQHSQDEVAGWLEALGVEEFSFNDSNPNGISVLLTKPS
ncbi:MAG: SAM-dependent methyltransferase/uncharacterized protein YbaR (Trm112 family) [Gammaproteobacteria bacterium]|jgi:SAM-dependent methyltransferase/uncharacterized protein YbaR (Trm112 family)